MTQPLFTESMADRWCTVMNRTDRPFTSSELQQLIGLTEWPSGASPTLARFKDGSYAARDTSGQPWTSHAPENTE